MELLEEESLDWLHPIFQSFLTLLTDSFQLLYLLLREVFLMTSWIRLLFWLLQPEQIILQLQPLLWISWEGIWQISYPNLLHLHHLPHLYPIPTITTRNSLSLHFLTMITTGEEVMEVTGKVTITRLITENPTESIVTTTITRMETEVMSIIEKVVTTIVFTIIIIHLQDIIPVSIIIVIIITITDLITISWPLRWWNPRRDIVANTVGKFFLGLQTWLVISGLILGNNLTNANTVRDPFPFHLIFRDMSETFITRKSPSSVLCVIEGLVNRQTLTDISRNTSRMVLRFWMILRRLPLQLKTMTKILLIRHFLMLSMTFETLWEDWLASKDSWRNLLMILSSLTDCQNKGKTCQMLQVIDYLCL